MGTYVNLQAQKSSLNIVGSIRTASTFVVPAGQFFEGAFVMSGVGFGGGLTTSIVNGSQIISLNLNLLNSNAFCISGKIFAGPGETITINPVAGCNTTISGLLYANT